MVETARRLGKPSGSGSTRCRRDRAHGTFTKSEMMIVAAARELAGQRVCFVGVGLPNIAVNLAKRTVAPDLELVYEAGVFGARPARLPLSIGDPTIVTGATAVDEHVRALRLLPPGRPDRRRLPRARPRSTGSATSTRRSSGRTTIRRPGCPGSRRRVRDRDQRPAGLRDHAPEQAQLRRDDRLPDVPGNLGGAEQTERIRREHGWLGRGPSVVVTDLGIYHFDETGEMRLDSLHPGATVEAGPRHDRLGRGGRPGPRRHAGADR